MNTDSEYSTISQLNGSNQINIGRETPADIFLKNSDVTIDITSER